MQQPVDFKTPPLLHSVSSLNIGELAVPLWSYRRVLGNISDRKLARGLMRVKAKSDLQVGVVTPVIRIGAYWSLTAGNPGHTELADIT